MGTEVIAATVVEAPAAEFPAWSMQARSPETEAMIEQWRHELENDRREAGERLASLMRKQPDPFARAEIVVAEGHSAEQLLKLAEARHVDLVVIGSGGKGALFRLFLGSTSDKVLTHAPCSVLVARAPEATSG
jgi:nucleotide-binding universal stress UspA family protein